MNPDAICNYQRQKMKENPFFPVKPEDFDKFEEISITIEGLKQLETLKHKCIMGRATIEKKIDCIDLMRIYATTNKSLTALKEWKKYIDRYFDELLKTRYVSDLLKDDFAMQNLKYDPKYMKSHETWFFTVVKKCYSLVDSGI